MGCVIALKQTLSGGFEPAHWGVSTRDALSADDWFPGDRGHGYRIKRLSACGGCLGDHRR